jgi:hypothetical protein
MLTSSNVFTVTSFDALAYNTILLVRFCCAFSRAVWLSRSRQCHTAPDKTLLLFFNSISDPSSPPGRHFPDPVRFCSFSYFAVFSKYFSLLLPASTLLPGGDEGTRTPGPRLAKAMLSQLSYIPSFSVGLKGLEPLTPALSAQCSNQLSYRPFPQQLKSDKKLLYASASRTARETSLCFHRARTHTLKCSFKSP